MRKTVLWGIAAAGLLAGCSYPRIVNGLSATDDQVKFLYKQDKWMGAPRVGVVKCERNNENALSGCQDLPIVYND